MHGDNQQAVLTIIDTAGIQDYIFGSNRLRENIGASFLVEQVTQEWAYEALPEPHNVIDQQTGEIDSGKRLEDGALAAELIYAGGGNTAILFRSVEEAHCFARKLSLRVLRDAPGLEIVIAHSEPFPWQPGGDDFYRRRRELSEGPLTYKKRARRATPLPLLGLGVTAECSSTGLVATQSGSGLELVDDDKAARLISREIVAKLEATRGADNAAKQRLLNFLRTADPKFDVDEFEFSDELDHLSRTGGEESYIAVVHIDGNDLSGLIDEYVRDAADNRACLERMRQFSAAVKDASGAAFVATLQQLRRRISTPDQQESGWQVIEVEPRFTAPEERVTTQQKKIRLYRKDKDSKLCWPFRPLVFGGDDVTFVCNGQLGLSLATIFMKTFTAETERRLKLRIHMGAGVCVVKVHYPFRRAYELSAALTKSAKRLLRAGKRQREASALDWHIAPTGLGGGLGDIRRREYTAPEGSLLMRPVWLSHQDEWRTWENFNQMAASFNYHRDWAGRRNKLKDLREALRNGKEAVQQFCALYNIKLPRLARAAADLHESGWEGRRCAYFDVIEAMDHHLLLEEVTLGGASNDDAD